MATVGELQVALEASLRDRGVIGDLKASLHAEIFKAISDEDSITQLRSAPKEIRVLNALIKEYLDSTGFVHTAKVFELETGADSIPRELLKAHLKIDLSGEAEKVPLLHALAFGHK